VAILAVTATTGHSLMGSAVEMPVPGPGGGSSRHVPAHPSVDRRTSACPGFRRRLQRHGPPLGM